MHYFKPLTPSTFLERSGHVFRDATAVRIDERALSYGQLLERARRLSATLRSLGVAYGDRVAILSENCADVIEANFGIPGAGGVIVSLNPWLTTAELVTQLRWVDCKLLLVHRDCLERHPAERLGEGGARDLLAFGEQKTPSVGGRACLDYEACLREATAETRLDDSVRDELDPLVINFTSGTTGTPKGVVMSHRAGYLHALGQVLMLGLESRSRYLWSLPIFHVNGWGHIWANACIGAEQIVLAPPGSLASEQHQYCARLRDLGVTHLAGAPRLLRKLLDFSGAELALRGCTLVAGGAAPMPALLERTDAVGARLIHQYGLNETFGPFVVCEEQPTWGQASAEERTRLRCRQGVAAIHAASGLRVVDERGRDVAADGVTRGQVVMAGNTVALGYYGDAAATRRAFVDGWFYSGDVAVVHPDGYLELKDRLKDLVHVETPYGWENVSSLDVERVLLEHPAVADAAVIGAPSADGQRTELVAMIEPTLEGAHESLRAHCERCLPEHMRPARFVTTTIPKTATGKVKKDQLRALVRSGDAA
jgi:fatty-acyl-CoA synthase